MADGLLQIEADRRDHADVTSAIIDFARLQYKPSTDDAQFPPARTRISHILLRNSAKAMDAALVLLIAAAGLYASTQSLMQASIAEALPFLTIAFAALIGTRACEAYHQTRSRPVSHHILRVASGTGLVLLVPIIGMMLVLNHDQILVPIITAQITWLSMIGFHAAYSLGIRAMVKTGQLSERVVIVGATPNATRLISRNSETRELNIVGVFDDRLERAPQDLSGIPILGRLDDLMSWERLPDIDRIIVTVTPDAKTRVQSLIERLRILPHRIVLLLDFEDFNPERTSLAEIARSPAAYVSGHPQDARRALVKRLSDIFFSSLMLVAFSPLMMLAALAIRLESKGPIFFRQHRHGFNNQIIRVWKLRTMHPDAKAERCIEQQVTPNDPRVTRVGRLLRMTSIDELPQLINVLRGDMLSGLDHTQLEWQPRKSLFMTLSRITPTATGLNRELLAGHRSITPAVLSSPKPK